jgi:hypothetical protein
MTTSLWVALASVALTQDLPRARSPDVKELVHQAIVE